MPPPPRQEQQPISAMDFLRGTPGQFRAHKQLPVEPEPVRTGRIPKRTRKLVWAIFGLWTLTIIGAVAYLQLTVYAGQIQRAANSAQLTPAASSGAGDATQPAQEPPSALNAIDDTAATEPPAQASPPLAGPAPGTSRPLHPSIQPASLPPVATPAEVLATSPQVLSAATAPVAPPPPVAAASVDSATLHAPIPPKPPPSAAPVASAPQLDLGLLLSRGNAMLGTRRHIRRTPVLRASGCSRQRRSGDQAWEHIRCCLPGIDPGEGYRRRPGRRDRLVPQGRRPRRH